MTSIQKKPKLLPFTFGATSHGWHAIQSFIPCPKEYQFKKVRGIRRKSAFVPEPLSIGLVLHAMRAQYLSDERQGELWKTAGKNYVEAHKKETGVALAPNAYTVALLCFTAYVKYWATRPFPQVLAVEHEIEPRPLVPDAPPWAWRGARLDSVEKTKGKVWLGELKSTSDSAHAVEDFYLLNGQTLLQAALYGPKEIEMFGPLGGVLLDVIVKPRGSQPAKAGGRVALPIEQMEHALTWFRRDFTTWVMQTHLVDWNAGVERKPLCMRKYGPCEYRDLCLLGRRGANGFVFPDGSPIVSWQSSKGKEVPPWE